MAEQSAEDRRRKANRVDLGMPSSQPSPDELKRIQQEKEAKELREKLAEQDRKRYNDWLKAKLEGDTRGYWQWFRTQRIQEAQPPLPEQEAVSLPDPAPTDSPTVAKQKADKKYPSKGKHKNSDWWQSMVRWFAYYSEHIDKTFTNKDFSKLAGVSEGHIKKTNRMYAPSK